MTEKDSFKESYYCCCDLIPWTFFLNNKETRKTQNEVQTVDYRLLILYFSQKTSTINFSILSMKLMFIFDALFVSFSLSSDRMLDKELNEQIPQWLCLHCVIDWDAVKAHSFKIIYCVFLNLVLYININVNIF